MPGTSAVQLCQGHCPVQHVAEEFPQLCEAEAQVFAKLLGSHVQRLATLATGAHACTTNVPVGISVPAPHRGWREPPWPTTSGRGGAVVGRDLTRGAPRPARTTSPKNLYRLPPPATTDSGRTTMSAPTQDAAGTALPTGEKQTDDEIIASIGAYEYGWHDSDEAGQIAQRGLNEDVVRNISRLKNEPEWMLNQRLKALRLFGKKPMPSWGSDLTGIDFDNIKYFVRSTEKQAATWDDLPEDIKETYDKLGIPEAEKQRLVAGVAAQYESEVVYHQINEELERQGVIFLDTDTALREHPEIFQEYFGTVIPSGDNKFAALNSAVWSGGSFVYVPPGVHVEIPLQAYFRINTENMGQFERTLIIADEGSYVHYVEGCTAPIYSSDSLHSAVVEIVVKKNARVRYTTIQNWSNNVYNLVTSGRPRPRARPWSGSTATSAPR